jgi:hypothetical protein
MKKIAILLIMLLISFMPVLSAQEDTDDTEWQKVAENSYVNLDGITGMEDIYGFSFLIKAYNKGQYEPVNGKKIWYTLSQYTIDCAKQKYKIGVIDSYGFKNNFVNGDYNRYATFQPIVQGTAVSAVAKELCRP